MPIFVSFFIGLRKAGDYFPSLSTGGLGWFTDLTVADPYMALPVLSGVAFLAVIEVQTFFYKKRPLV